MRSHQKMRNEECWTIHRENTQGGEGREVVCTFDHMYMCILYRYVPTYVPFFKYLAIFTFFTFFTFTVYQSNESKIDLPLFPLFHTSSLSSSRKPTHCTRSVQFRKPTSFAFSGGTPHRPAHSPTILPDGDRVLAGNVQGTGGRDRVLVCRQKRKVPTLFFAHTDDVGQLRGTDVRLVVVAVRKKGDKDFHVVADRFARRFFVVRDRDALGQGVAQRGGTTGSNPTWINLEGGAGVRGDHVDLVVERNQGQFRLRVLGVDVCQIGVQRSQCFGAKGPHAATAVGNEDVAGGIVDLFGVLGGLW